jgi:hypothetical protein
MLDTVFEMSKTAEARNGTVGWQSLYIFCRVDGIAKRPVYRFSEWLGKAGGSIDPYELPQYE